MPKRRALLVAGGIVASFIAFVVAIGLVARAGMISVELAKLMFFALLGMYIGFGALIAIYRLISKLD